MRLRQQGTHGNREVDSGECKVVYPILLGLPLPLARGSPSTLHKTPAQCKATAASQVGQVPSGVAHYMEYVHSGSCKDNGTQCSECRLTAQDTMKNLS